MAPAIWRRRAAVSFSPIDKIDKRFSARFSASLAAHRP
jgi:hypothetical protein